MILPTWLDHLEESFSHNEVQFKTFCLPLKTSCPPAENVNEAPDCSTYIYVVLPYSLLEPVHVSIQYCWVETFAREKCLLYSSVKYYPFIERHPI